MDTALHQDRSVWKGAVAGIAAGVVASWTMNQLQAALSRTSRLTHGDRERGQAERQEGDDDATMRAAQAISKGVTGRRLTDEQKQTAGPALHYAFGTSMAAAYGALAELTPRTSAAWGLPFGTALWLVADEIAVPALGLSKPPREYPVTTHASALAAHLVYGATTDLVRRAIRAAW
jgi:putative membrane protein